MKQEKLINFLGYVILLGICCFGLFASSTILLSGYILLLFVVSSFRIHLWKKSRKKNGTFISLGVRPFCCTQ